jgi:hypothetical protein
MSSASPIKENYPNFRRLFLSPSLVPVDFYSVLRRLIDFENLVGFIVDHSGREV